VTFNLVSVLFKWLSIVAELEDETPEDSSSAKINLIYQSIDKILKS
jgi:hypothetical protein